MKKAISLLFAICLLLTASCAIADDGFSTSYTYTYNYWGEVQQSPDAYRVAKVIDNTYLGLENLENTLINRAQSIYVRDKSIYICDTTNNRIVEIEKKGTEYQVCRIIKEMKGAENNTFSSPYDVFIDENYNIYVADYGNQRVIMMDKDLNWQNEYTKPDDATFEQSQSFLPKKIVVDVAGRVYALCQNINKGLVKFEKDGSFSGFIGANEVTVSMGDYIWNNVHNPQILFPLNMKTSILTRMGSSMLLRSCSVRVT